MLSVTCDWCFTISITRITSYYSSVWSILFFTGYIEVYYFLSFKHSHTASFSNWISHEVLTTVFESAAATIYQSNSDVSWEVNCCITSALCWWVTHTSSRQCQDTPNKMHHTAVFHILMITVYGNAFQQYKTYSKCSVLYIYTNNSFLCGCMIFPCNWKKSHFLMEC